ncbi:MAG: hypothetical protein ACUVWX_10580, partial [Kiritimatiellia bacterium]
MQQFEIRDQVKLPLRKCAELVLSGIQFRLFRASITVAIVALAVAFLMTILGDGLVGWRVAEVLHEVTRPRRTFLTWLARLSGRMSESAFTTALMSAEPGSDRWE